MNGESIAFDEFEIDPARGELRRAGAPVAIEPQVLDLIAHLAGRPGQIVTRDELIAHVWGGRIVSDSAISTRINAARAALGDDGAAQRLIKTVPRRGFRFEVAVRDAAGAPPPTRDKPSVAVLPPALHPLPRRRNRGGRCLRAGAESHSARVARRA